MRGTWKRRTIGHRSSTGLDLLASMAFTGEKWREFPSVVGLLGGSLEAILEDCRLLQARYREGEATVTAVEPKRTLLGTLLRTPSSSRLLPRSRGLMSTVNYGAPSGPLSSS